MKASGRLGDVKILLGGGQDNEDSFRTNISKADRSTLQIHRANENNEEYAEIYKKDVRVQTWVAR